MGAGFAGLTAARALRRAPVDVLLVDRNNFHLFTPLLYQVASALLDPGEIAQSVRSLIRPLRNADFRLAEVTGVDLAARHVVTREGALAYDYLLLAAGSENNFFGIASLERHALGLKALDEGLAVRNRVLRALEASRWAEPAHRHALLTFAVVGGGPTGVEMAGALSELIRLVLRRDFRDLDLGQVRVVLLEGTDRLLAAFEPSLSAAAAAALRRKGVEVWFGAQVKDLNRGQLRLVDGRRVAAGTVVWTAGVRASGLGARLGLELARQGRIRVEPTLQLPGHPEVFVAGDLAGLEAAGAPLPMLIPVAMQEARHAARGIASLLAGGTPPPFAYRDPGIMATIGRNAAVAQLGRVHLAGFPGWLMWLFVHLVNVVSFRSRLVVLVNWAWEYLFYDRPIRLIVRARPDE